MKVFISCVSKEFETYREPLKCHLEMVQGGGVEVKIQEDFISHGGTLLELLADYIKDCGAVVHLAGELCGDSPSEEHERALIAKVEALRYLGDTAPHLSYTQWEYVLARAFGRKCYVYIPNPETTVQRSPRYKEALEKHKEDATLSIRQQNHKTDIHRHGVVWSEFTTVPELRSKVFKDLQLDDKYIDMVTSKYAAIGNLFKGRDSFLKEIQEKFSSTQQAENPKEGNGKKIVLQGLGGVGKTRAAIEYARRHKEEYNALLIATGDSSESLQASIADFCGALVLNLPVASDSQLKERLEQAQNWLKNHPGWLMIVDNVDTKEAVEAVGMITETITTRGQMLVTSRISDWPAGFEVLELPVLKEEDAVDFLKTRADQRRIPSETEDEEHVALLANELGGLPLILEQAGAQINYESLSFREYRAEWHRNRAQVLGWGENITGDPHSAVSTTWLTSFNQLDEKAQHLLCVLAWFGSDAIPVPPGDNGKNVFGDLPPKVSSDLVAYSLVSRKTKEKKEDVVSIHRLVQDVTRMRMDTGSKQATLSDALRRLDAAFIGDPKDRKDWPKMEPLVPHVSAVVEHAKNPEWACETELVRLSLPNQLANFMTHAKGDFANAEPIFIWLVKTSKAAFGADSPETLTRLNDLAFMLYRGGRYDEALRYYRRLLEARKRKYGMEHKDTLRSAGEMGAVLIEARKKDEAFDLLREVVETCERCHFLSDTRPVVETFALDAAMYYADVLCERNNASESKKYAEIAFKWNKLIRGVDHNWTLRSQNYLAGAYAGLGDFQKAVELDRDIIKKREATLGHNHPDTALSIGNLGVDLKSSGNREEAEKCYRTAFEIYKKSGLDKEHRYALHVTRNLARLLIQTNLIEAESLIRQVIKGQVDTLGARHLATQQSCGYFLMIITKKLVHIPVWSIVENALAFLYSSGCYKLAHDFISQIKEAAHHDSVRTNILYWQGMLKETMGDYQEAESLQRELVAELPTGFKDGKPDPLDCINNFAVLLNKMAKFDEAEKHFSDILEKRESLFSTEGHPQRIMIFRCMSTFATLYARKGDFAIAEVFLRRAIEEQTRILEKLDDRRHHYVLDSESNLAVLAMLKGDWKDAEPLFRKVLDGYKRALGRAHVDTLSAMSNMGVFLLHVHDHVKGDELLQWSEQEDGTWWKPEKGETSDDIFRRALDGTWWEMGADELLHDVLEKRKNALGDKHPDTLASLNNLGVLLARKNDWQGAEECFRLAAEGRAQVLGNEHPDTLASMENLKALLSFIQGIPNPETHLPLQTTFTFFP